MALKIYLAGRISRQKEVQMILSRLKEAGIKITRDWTWTTAIMDEKEAGEFRRKAYATRDPKYQKEAEDDLNAVLDADVFIILTDEHGSGMYVEMGAAFAGQKLRNKPTYIYAIGPHFDRTVFYQHEFVVQVDDVDGILIDLKKKKLIDSY